MKPARHWAQRPQESTITSETTRSPTTRSVTSAPTATISPQFSAPGITGTANGIPGVDFQT
jgi:hypothetical protein